MKSFFLDCLLVVLLLCLCDLYFSNHQVSSTLFQREITAFEKNQTPSTKEVVLISQEDNKIGKICHIMSEGCIKVIEFFTLIFSDFISLFLFHMHFLN